MKNLTILAAAILMLSCKNEPAQKSITGSENTPTEKITTQPDPTSQKFDDKKAIAMLRTFYTEYISANLEDISPENDAKILAIKQKYCTTKALDDMALMDIDFDPFVNAQDYNENMIKDLTITKTATNTFSACPYVDEKPMCCTLKVDIVNGTYKISRIIPQ